MTSRLPHPRAFVLTVLVLVVAATAASSGRVPLDVADGSDGTPWVTAAGRFVAATWGATRDGKTDVFLAVSRDGGATFGAPVQVNTVRGEARLGGEMPPRVALHMTRGGATPEIVVLWTARGTTTQIKMARSQDGGKTFGAPVTVSSAGAAGDRGWPAVTIDPRSVVHAIWLDHRGMASGQAAAGHTGHQAGAPHDGVAMAQKSGLYYASTAGARASERALTTGVCYCCKTAIAAGPDGALYAAWRHVHAGNLRDIAFTVSRDRGRTFSSPTRVSEDRWAIDGCPDDGPALSVDAGGTVHVIWPTVIGGARPEGALFYSYTRDGRQFAPRIRIPTLGGAKPSHPQIVATGTGRLYVAWDEGLDGQRVPAFREVIRGGERVTFGEIVRLSTAPGFYPVLAATDTGLVAVWATGGSPSRVETRAVRVP